jgi:DNA-binding helix-hairpin-helix protein with protein kinase domain
MAPPLQILHPRLQQLFVRCFEDGHFAAHLRPDEREWQHAITEAEQSLIACGRKPQHWYGNHLRSCPWCERTAQLGGIDPFPAKITVRGNCASTTARTRVGRPSRRTWSPMTNFAFTRWIFTLVEFCEFLLVRLRFLGRLAKVVR